MVISLRRKKSGQKTPTTPSAPEDTSSDLEDFSTKKVTFVPHPNTVTQAGDYEYYSNEGKHPLPYALAELVDNSIQATKQNPAYEIERKVRVVIVDDKKNTFIACWDNGKGMSEKGLNDWAVMGIPKETESVEHESEDDRVKRFINSNISRFGVGSKHAAFYIGGEVTVITKQRTDEYVREIRVNAEEMLDRHRAGENAYSADIVTRRPNNRQIRDSREAACAALRDLYDEKTEESFTLVLIKDLKKDVLSQFFDGYHADLCEKSVKYIAEELTHLYYYYIHGPEGIQFPEAETPRWKGKLTISVERIPLDRRSPMTLLLQDVDTDLESRLLRSQKHHFDFEVEISENKTPKPDDKRIQGVIFYYPKIGDQEVLETVLRGSGSGGSDSDVDPESEADEAGEAGETSSTPSRQSHRNPPVFECFWNGRLIPKSFVDRLFFCTLPTGRAAAQKDQVPDECYRRIKGMLFLNSRFQVTRNKLTVKDDIKALVCDNDPDVRFTPRVNISKKFRDWLKECHERFDQTILFKDHLNGHALCHDSITCGAELELKKGDIIRVQHPSYLARIGYFKRDGTAAMPLETGKAVVFRLPEELYGDQKEVSINRLLRQHKLLLAPEEADSSLRAARQKAPSKLQVSTPGCSHISYSLSSQRPIRLKAGDAWPDTHVLVKNGSGIVMKSFESKNDIRVTLSIVKLGPSNEKKFEIGTTSAPDGIFVFKQVDDMFKQKGQYEIHLQVNFGSQFAKTIPPHRISIVVSEAAPHSYSLARPIDPVPTRAGASGPDIILQINDIHGNEVTTSGTEYRACIAAAEGSLGIPSPETLVPSLQDGKLILRGWKIDLPNQDHCVQTVFTRADTPLHAKFNVSIKTLLPPVLPISIGILPGFPDTLEFIQEPLGDKYLVEAGATLPTVEIRVLDRWRNPVGPANDLAGMTLTASCDNLNPPVVSTDISPANGVAAFSSLVVAGVPGPGVSCVLRFDLRWPLPDGRTGIITRQKLLDIRPNMRPSKLRVCFRNSFHVPDDQGQTVCIGQVGNVIEPVEVHLLTHSGTQAELVDGYISSSWTGVEKVHCASATVRVPTLHLPTPVSTSPVNHFVRYESNETGRAIELQFSFVLTPDEPVQWRLFTSEALPEGTIPVMQAGQAIPYSIYAEAVDKYGNPCTLPKTIGLKFKVKDDTENPHCPFKYDKDKVKPKRVKNLPWTRFEIQNLLPRGGPQKVHFDLRSSGDTHNIKGTTMEVELIPGPPHSLTVLPPCIDCHTRDLLTVPVKVYVTDEGGTKLQSSEAQIHINPNPAPGLRLSQSLSSASNTAIVYMTDNGMAHLNRQPLYIYAETPGTFTVPISSPGLQGAASLTMKVAPSNRAVRVLCRPLDDVPGLCAGMPLPSFAVSVETEDQVPIHPVSPQSLQVLVRDPNGQEFFLSCRDWQGSTTTEGQTPYIFNSTEVLRTAGPASAMAIYTETRPELTQVLPQEELMLISAPATILVAPGPVMKMHVLAQVPQASSLSACNSGIAEGRQLLERISFGFYDSFNNRVLHPPIPTVQVSLESGPSDLTAPKLDPPLAAIVSPHTGMAVFSSISVAEHTGDDDGHFRLVFSVPSSDIPPVEFPVVFTHNSRHLKRLRELEVERTQLMLHLQSLEKRKADAEAEVRGAERALGEPRKKLLDQHMDLRTPTELFPAVEFCEAHRAIPSSMQCATCSAAVQENLALVAGQISVMQQYKPREARVSGYYTEKNQMLQQLRIMAHNGQDGVVGVLADLAYIDDPQVAQVVSWHLGSHLNLVVVKTTENVNRLRDHFISLGLKQYLPDIVPLDCIRHTRSYFREPLQLPYQPQVRPAGLYATGFAVNQFTAVRPELERDVASLFYENLGNTLLFDNLRNAQDYRRKGAQANVRMPTMLALTGERITSLGAVSGESAKPLADLMTVLGESPMVSRPIFVLHLNRQDKLKNYQRTAHQVAVLFQEAAKKKKEKDDLVAVLAPDIAATQAALFGKQQEKAQVERDMQARLENGPEKRQRIG